MQENNAMAPTRKEGKSEMTKSGYKNPPVHSRFKPGQSGNPRGRPRGSNNSREFLERALGEYMTMKLNGKTIRVTRSEAIVLGVLSKALRGDLNAIRWIDEHFPEWMAQLENPAQSTQAIRQRIMDVFEEVLGKTERAKALLDGRIIDC
jgi:hypothetical protein